MSIYVIYALLAVIVLFIAYIIIIAALAAKKRKTSKEYRKNVDENKLELYVNKLSKMLKCKTVYTDDQKYEEEFIETDRNSCRYCTALSRHFIWIHARVAGRKDRKPKRHLRLERNGTGSHVIQ